MRRILGIMRRMPFWVTAMYIPYVLLSFADADVWYVATQTFYISPVAGLIVLYAGHPLNFCAWWKIQCLVPVIPTAAAIYAHFFIMGRVWVCIAAMVLVFLLSIVNGIKVFINR